MFRNISDKMTEERAKKIYDQEMKVEQDYYEYLTGIFIFSLNILFFIFYK